jgi:hypothetical protein
MMLSGSSRAQQAQSRRINPVTEILEKDYPEIRRLRSE